MSDLVATIQAAQFSPVRFGAGYDAGEVDQLLDELVAAVQAGRPLAPLVASARFTPTRLREGYAMSEVDDFLASLGGASPTQAPTLAPAEAPPTVAPPTPSPLSVGPGAVVQEQKGLLSRLFGRG